MSAASHLLPFLPAILAIFLVARQLRRNRLLAAEPRPVRRLATLHAPFTGSETRAWHFGLLATALPILATATLLKLHWHAIPDRFPVHWGINGQPNAWTDRSLSSTFGPLLFAVILVAFLALLGELVSRFSPGYDGRHAMLRTMRGILLAVAWFLTLLLCAVSLLPLARNPTSFVPRLTFASVLVSVGILLLVGYRSTTLSENIAASQDTTDARFWKAGLLYINRNDSALLVPKRYGFGYTFNFGRPISWFLLAAILLLPFLLPLLFHRAARP